MARTLIRIEPIVPAEKEYPLNRWTRFEKLCVAYMSGPLNKMLIDEFNKTIKNWDAPPTFIGTFSRPRGVSFQLVVDPKGPGTLKWTRVSGGVKGHRIKPRGPWLLNFQPKYKPHTKPGGKWGGPGSYEGHAQAAEVKWPGIKPREFSLEIKKDKEKEIRTAIEAIIRKAFG